MSERRSRKLFGLFNIVDILLILLVIAAGIIGAKLFLGGTGQQAAAEMKTYSYVVQGQEVLEETAQFPVIGGKAFNSSTSVYLGTVTEVASEPHTETMYNRVTEQYEKVPIKDYCNLSVTIEGQGTETDRDIIVEGTPVKVGMELNVKGKGYAFKGFVVEVRDGE